MGIYFMTTALRTKVFRFHIYENIFFYGRKEEGEETCFLCFAPHMDGWVHLKIKSGWEIIH